ncbi:uncharacterized protein LOC142337846 isoform X1 [Convolutriloba macropyga]|uniref:uncharacterized protein LOC142337846 isoform X1 n=1 Tax=Convolutriloba macropyga TaxID=536237 RepID=UPI003F51BF0C
MIRVPGLIDVELTLSVEYDFAPWAHPSTGEKLDFDYFHYTIRNAVAVWDILVCFCILIANIYCLLCFANVRELRAFEFGLIFIQTLTDIIGTLFYATVVIENYVSRYLFYCMPDWEQIQLLCRIENLTFFF